MKQPLPPLQTIYDFAKLLDLAELGFDAEDVADAAWLAQFIPSEPEMDDAGDPELEDDDLQDAPIIERREGTTTEGTIPVATAPALSPQTDSTEDAPSLGISIQIPAAPALRARRDLAKALRPIMRRVPSRTATRFDDDATTEQIAEQGIWTAVMAPAPERWFELAIVVEQSPSTPLWQDTLAELKLLTERQGAFRRVSTWQIQMQGHVPVLHPNWHQGDRFKPTCNHRTLIDPAGRRLIWLVSDCTSALWQQPQIYQWLRDWGKQCPVALVQLFPGRLWWRTALGDGVPVRLSAYTPGVPNAQLQVSEVLPFSALAQALGTQPSHVMQAFHKFQQETLATVPVVSLEAYPLNQWAKVVAGGGDIYTPGYCFNEATLQAYRERKQATPPSRQLSPKEQVQQFQKTASDTAFKLAGLMAAAPVSPPIIQLIQQTLLPESQQVHVAEVYMSGLLRAVTPADAKLPPHKIQYDFLNDEIRECLTDYMPIAKTEAVLDAVSAYISERLGLQTRTYEALLLLGLEGRPQDQKVVLPFARIAKRALQRLGGDYAQLADYIDVPNRPQIPVPLPPLKDFPELNALEFEYPLITFEETPDDQEDLGLELRNFEFETLLVDGRGVEIQRVTETAAYFIEYIKDSSSGSQDSSKVGARAIEAQQRRISRRLATLEQSLGRVTLQRAQTLESSQAEHLRKQQEQIEQELRETAKVYQDLDTQIRDLRANGAVFLDMVAIPGSTFLMGSPDDEPKRFYREGPQHEVTVPPFFMAKTPITQAQWRAVAQLDQVDRELDPNRSSFKGDNRPVEQVSWYHATEFCARLSQFTGRDYRLPSEAEWEYACRAGTTTPFYFGETITPDLANYDGNYTYNQGPKGINRKETTEVGSFPPNAFGLYDMHGNVYEWCQDHWQSNYEGEPPTDGSAWLFSDERKEKDDRSRVLRGGSWFSFPWLCRSAFSFYDFPDARLSGYGFRVVCSAARALQ